MTPNPTFEEEVMAEAPAPKPEENKFIQIVVEKPPVWDRAHEVFDIDDSSTVYAYGNKIYNPANIQGIPQHVIEHELVHIRQQEAIGGAEKWWNLYLTEEIFRINQEIEAYRVQYAFYCLANRDRNAQARFLNSLGGFMASNMYGAPMSKIEAMKAIRN